MRGFLTDYWWLLLVLVLAARFAWRHRRKRQR
jgi:MYXO-CTERM domain-containing protein